MSGRLVKIASYWNLPEGELAQALLAADGIRAWLGNTTLVSWFWHYGNAVGGVTLHVSETDAGRAQEILAPEGPQESEEETTWKCPGCAEQIEGSWLLCWNCGMSSDGTRRPTSEEERPGPRPSRESDARPIAGLAVLIGLFVVMGGGLPAAIAAWPVVVALLAWFLCLSQERSARPIQEPAHHEEVQPANEALSESCVQGRRAGEAIALRAWRASLFGLLWFPPLLLYSVWLLLRLDPKKTPLGRRGRRHRRAAWTVSLTGMNLFGWYAAAMIFFNWF